MKRTYRIAQATALALWAAACAGSAKPADVSPFDGRNAQPVLLTVDNQDFRDATIYVIWNGPKQRVGSVTGKTTKTFSMQWREYQMRLDVDFLGGGGLTGDPISVYAGDHIDFVIQPGW
jgi:hypothetical protein